MIRPQKVAPEEIEEEEKVGNGNQPPLADGSILAKVGKPAPHFNLEVNFIFVTILFI